MPDWETALVQFAIGLVYAIIQGAVTGKLNAPTVVHEGIPDPITDAEVENAITADIAAGVVPGK